MRLGVFLLSGRFPGQSDRDALRRASDAVVWAEQAGFDDAWMAEHHFMSYGVCPSAITFAAHALGRTERITVGTAVSVLSTTHPVMLAEQVTMLDQMSGGRFHLGVGRGGPWRDLEVFGTGLDRWEHGFAESLDLLLDCLTSPVVGSTGRFEFREVPMVPQPVARPRVTVACTSKGTVALAAQRGLPMLLGMDLGNADKAAMIKAYQEAGGGPAPHVGAALAHVANTREQAVSELRAAMPGWLGPGIAGYVPVDARPRRHRDPVGYMEKLLGISPVGTPEQCGEWLRGNTSGLEHYILMVDGCGDPQITRRTIERLGAYLTGSSASPDF
ncbi:alkanesulfonate monooxygenase SsuD/methylene tetrahydromethanopterin reductase-like flavin-dependent oxidoreductase (luciferase family) [Kibdelosporangium banguiense]|uniref:Alkanesulfonate monooxygenase SsuD/methylene tetrahydromethanopterin reductase-like flavin-dependent oxidoreductase (Luciferase family) n=1 Tax=Kibdelosporangium banguiense TaxID=1365924 RepID=A0ABS4TMU5_9PSEU|nr:LLM class flavin-dependent oxidoreductase [Kibdelosporangium banguiense]MBP2325725.1 alkanesulfonate monooxygenase SsuD/methylene tetrahydromethanopterin reductase-like flavin-dependent oxidoreductase (luciferase family) [Kibdelosporangium banguiense]